MTLRRLTFIVCVAVTGCSAGVATPSVDGSAAAGLARSLSSSAWTIVSSPNAPLGTDGLYDDMLYGAGGSSAGDVWAVGNDCCYAHGTQEYDHSLALHWNGSAWSIVHRAANAPEDTTLHAVASLSPTDAWAVGNAPYPDNQPVFEHWDGRAWRAVASPIIANNGEMNSVVAISKDNVWAAGEGNFAAVLEQWNGHKWNFIPAYNQGVTVLNGIAAAGPNDIWAVGEFLDPAVGLFTEHYDGKAWTYYPAVDPFFAASFQSVTVLSPKNAWAVGYEEPSEQSEVPQTLIEHFDGSKWNLVKSPNRNPKGGDHLYNILDGVAAHSPSDIWAVGGWTWLTGDGTTRSLFLHYNGNAWRYVAAPPPLDSSDDETINQLLGIAQIPSGGFWAVGSQDIPPAEGEQTLVVHHP